MLNIKMNLSIEFPCSEIEIEISRYEYDVSEDAVVVARNDMKMTDIFPIKSGIKNHQVQQSQQSTPSNFGKNTYMVEKVSNLYF